MPEETNETLEEKTQYVGEKKVDSVTVDNADMKFVFVKLEGEEEPLRLHPHIYDIIKSDEPCKGSPEELKWLGLAKEFLNTLMDYDLPFWEVTAIGTNMQNLIANAHNDATKKLWGKPESSRTISDINTVLKA